MTYDETAERALLACLLNGADVDDAAAIVQPRDLYQPRNEAVYAAVLQVHQRRDRVDPVTLPVPQAARPYVMELALPEVPPVPAQAPHYARQVADAALRRRLVEAGTKVTQLAQSDLDATQAAQDAQQAITEAAEQARPAEGGSTVGDALAGTIDWLENEPVGADTPWPDVNRMTNGLLAGQMITVAARPGGGKSVLAKDVAAFTARLGKPAHIATMEMSRREYLARILASVAQVPLSNMLNRSMSDREWEKIAQAEPLVRDLPLYLDDRERQSMAQIRAAARATARRYGQDLGLIAIDYAQLVRPENPRDVREQQVAQISRDTKLMAKEFGCPVLLLAQLNRRGADRSDPTPLVTDLRESGSLEQDSDQVWLLHRPDQYGDETRLGEVDLIVGKNRNGPAPVTIPLAFQGHYARMVSLA